MDGDGMCVALEDVVVIVVVGMLWTVVIAECLGSLLIPRNAVLGALLALRDGRKHDAIEMVRNKSRCVNMAMDD